MNLTNMKTIKEYILTEEEIKLIRECLNYCFHRLDKHDNSGIKGRVNIQKLDILRKELWT